MNVTEIEQGTDAWWDFIRAAKTAEESGRKLSISVTVNGRGVPMVAFKVGEGMWTAHRPVTRGGEPRSLGGDLPISRRCWRGQHSECKGSWTAYPDESGSCECKCHDGN